MCRRQEQRQNEETGNTLKQISCDCLEILQFISCKEDIQKKHECGRHIESKKYEIAERDARIYDHEPSHREVPSCRECDCVAQQQLETTMLRRDQAYNTETIARVINHPWGPALTMSLSKITSQPEPQRHVNVLNALPHQPSTS